MATIQKRGGKYRAIVRKKGYTQAATFTRKPMLLLCAITQVAALSLPIYPTVLSGIP